MASGGGTSALLDDALTATMVIATAIIRPLSNQTAAESSYSSITTPRLSTTTTNPYPATKRLGTGWLNFCDDKGERCNTVSADYSLPMQTKAPYKVDGYYYPPAVIEN